MKFITLMFFLMLSQLISADDLDDGIEIDEAINDDLKLETNIQFITRKAKAASSSSNKGKRILANVIVNDGCEGTGNQIFGAGANLQNAVIVNLSDNRNSTNACAQ